MTQGSGQRGRTCDTRLAQPSTQDSVSPVLKSQRCGNGWRGQVKRGTKGLLQRKRCSATCLKQPQRMPFHTFTTLRKLKIIVGEEHARLHHRGAESRLNNGYDVRKLEKTEGLQEKKAGGAQGQCLGSLTPLWTASRKTNTIEYHGAQRRGNWNCLGSTSSGSQAQRQNSAQLFHYLGVPSELFEFSVSQCACP